MRKITVTEAPKEEPKPLTVADIKREAFFQCKNRLGCWHHLTDEVEYPVASIPNCTLFGRGALGWIVTRVLAPGESLTIGPEVQDE